MNRYDDPRWYENQQPQQGQQAPPPNHNDFDQYPFLPNQQNDSQYPGGYMPQGYDTAPPPSRWQRTLGQGISLIALVVVAFVGGWFSHQFFANSYNQADTSQKYAKVLQEAWSTIDQNYVDRDAVNYEKMTQAAINAMLETLGDQGHTRYMDPKTVKAENQQLSGKFTGVGIYLRQDPNTKQLIITSPIQDSPAEKAGIKRGDIIVAVNGQSTEGKDVKGVSTLIQGKEGTEVTIRIQRPGENGTRDFKLKRSEIRVPNVTMHYIPETRTAHIHIVQFADGISEQLKDKITKAKDQGAQKFVLDLRDNPGGYLNEAVKTVSLFINDGTVLLEQDKSGKREAVKVTGNAIDTTSPLVVLINGNSASAAEIVSGSLKENKRATIIGQTTFGTGTVLRQFPLSDGSAILLGVQEWLTPEGKFIRKDPKTNKGGIEPSEGFKVELGKNDVRLTPDMASESNMNEQQIRESKDPQLIKALDYLKSLK